MNNPYYLKDTEGDYYNKYPEFQAWEEGKQAGIKEIVEWIEGNKGFYEGDDAFTILDFQWQSKLKEWGIE